MFGKGSLIILLLTAYCDYCIGCRKFYLTKDGDTIEAIAKDNPPLTFSQLRYLNPDVGLKNLSVKTNLCIDADDVAVKDNKLCKRYGPIDADIESVSDNFPWLVHIRAQDPAGDNGEMDSQYCTGTLLNARAVLTTRTCVTNDPNQGTMRPAANHGVALAVDKISGFGLPYVPVEKIFPGQHFKIAGDDIAILQLSQPVAATEFVHLPESREQVLCPDTAGSLVGWDPYATDTGVTVQRINGHIMESDKGCRGFYLDNNAPAENITEKILCSDLEKPMKPCDGYVGSPLVVHDKTTDNFVQLGIATLALRTFQCDNNHFVYVNVAKHLSWIQQTLKEI